MADVEVEVENKTANGLYLMAIFCIVLGSYRSVEFVRDHKKNGRKIENSVSEKEAKWFPITASSVLFGLYFLFKYTGEGGLTLLKTNLRGLLTNYSMNSLADLTILDVPEPSPVTETIVEDVAVNGTANMTALAIVKSYVKMVGKQDLMNLLLILICFQGCQALAHILKPLVSRVLKALPLSEEREIKQNLWYELRFSRAKTENAKKKEDLFFLSFDTHDLISLLTFLPVGALHIYYRHWITNDIIGVAFSLFAIEMLHLGSFKGGLFMLAGLFVYDVFWVFCTDVMTTVATNINAPILLQFPQDLLRHGVLAGTKHSMLGLGDIVIPGIFLALLMRFDEGVATKAPKKPRHYFWMTIVAYAIGLVLTIFVMHYFKAAQPALLYLVPLCIGAPMLMAVCKGELKELMAFNESHLVKQDDEDETPKKKQKKNEDTEDNKEDKKNGKEISEKSTSRRSKKTEDKKEK